ncbi:MAG: DNA repair protein RecO [Ruminococcaceae bacterium]|nr:DNA repair protein RecO [Oscillospiraceae bacterium]
METITTNGLVIKQTNYGEADRILHIFTEKLGIVSVLCKGARKYKSHQGSASQLLYYSSFTLVSGKGMYQMRGASTIESFFSLSESLEKIALCTYLFDITKALVPENMPEQAVLSLLLNTLYILKTKERDLSLIKAAYELRLLALTGYMANCEECCICARGCKAAYFSSSHGGIVCDNCPPPADSIKISSSVQKAMDYITKNDADKIYSFTISDDAARELGVACEKFLLSCAERNFLSLDYYKSVCEL